MLPLLKTAILARFPQLTNASFRLLTAGWDSIAVDVDDRLIFKFPRDEEGTEALRREASLLEVIRPRLTLPVPDLIFYESPRPFSRHTKLQGEHLTTSQYEELSDQAKQQLAETIARFYAELHALPPSLLQTAGALPIDEWPTPTTILTGIQPRLPEALFRKAERLIAEWADQPADPYGTVYGFFDGHGWNMAFDQANQVLNGIYDFADSGFGELHQEFIYTNFIAAELTATVITQYEQLTGRFIDRHRVSLLMGLLLLTELSELGDDADYGTLVVENALQWLSVH